MLDVEQLLETRETRLGNPDFGFASDIQTFGSIPTIRTQILVYAVDDTRATVGLALEPA